MLLVPDTEDASCCFHDVVGGGFELVNLEGTGEARKDVELREVRLP